MLEVLEEMLLVILPSRMERRPMCILVKACWYNRGVGQSTMKNDREHLVPLLATDI